MINFSLQLLISHKHLQRIQNNKSAEAKSANYQNSITQRPLPRDPPRINNQGFPSGMNNAPSSGNKSGLKLSLNLRALQCALFNVKSQSMTMHCNNTVFRQPDPVWP